MSTPDQLEPTVRFKNRRDELLYEMWQRGWVNDQSGEADAPERRFALLTIEEADLPYITNYHGFRKQLQELAVDPEKLLGHWLIAEDEFDLVFVTKYVPHEALVLALEAKDRAFRYWKQNGGSL